MCTCEHALNILSQKENSLIILVQNKCFTVPNTILLIYTLKIDHDLFNTTKLKPIIILNIHAPLLMLQLKSPPTIISNHGVFGNPTWWIQLTVAPSVMVLHLITVFPNEI